MPETHLENHRWKILIEEYVDHLTGQLIFRRFNERQVVWEWQDKVWVHTPNFKKLQKEGNLPMNAFYFKRVREAWFGDSFERAQYRDSEGQIYHDQELRRYGPQEPYLSAPSKPQLDSQNLTDRANTKVLLKLKNQKVNLVQAFAERGQTTRLFQNTVGRIVTAVRSLKKANWNGAAQALGVKQSRGKHNAYSKKFARDPGQATSQGWLELQYGWRPLLSDVYGSIELVNKKRGRNNPTRVISSVADESTGQHTFSPDGFLTVHIRTRRKTTLKHTLYYRLPSENLKTLSEVGITNPALIAWELLPWSFVVDWVLPVGNFISSWDATTGLEFEKGVKTLADEWFFSATHVGRRQAMANNGFVQRIDNTRCARKEFELSRGGISGFPVISPPRIKNPISGEHMANLAALLKTTFGKRS